ncbi:hypothetical protein [Oleiharenicola sp. Vm1]
MNLGDIPKSVLVAGAVTLGWIGYRVWKISRAPGRIDWRRGIRFRWK